MNVQDSLDNLSALHIDKQRSLQAQVKHKFVIALEKLQSSETREIGISQLRKLIDNYRQPEHLRNYIAILKTLKPNPNSATKEHEILVISILATIFKTQLQDPIDKPPSVVKTTFRLVQVLHGYFADRSATVQQACARALLDLSTHCLSNQEKDTIFSIIYSPLISILKTGVDKGSQATAAACLSELISNCKRTGFKEMLNKLAPELLAVILRVNCQYHQLFQAVSTMIEVKGLGFLENKTVNFLAKVLAVLSGTRETPNAGSLNSYMCKVHVCKIIQSIGLLMASSEKDKLSDLNVIDALVQASRNRIIQVQLAASRALKAWRGEEMSPPKGGLMSLQEKRNSKLRERSRSKDQQEKLEKELTYMKEDLDKLVKGGWGASNRAKNYVRRGSGVGGGSHGKAELSPPNRSSGKSHKEHFQQLRQYIKKGAQQNKNIDRFALPSHQKKQNRSPPPHDRSKSPPKQILKYKKQPSQEREMEQPQLQMDQGDQMVNEPIKKKSSTQKRSSSKILQEAGISAEEANDLMNHQQTLMDEEMNVNYYSEKNRKNSSDKDSLELNPKKVYENPKKAQDKQDFSIPLQPQSQLQSQPQHTPPPLTFKKQEQQRQSRILSQEQIGDLVQEYNLSQVSENLNGILNQSDLHMMEQSTPNSSMDGSRSKIQQIREKQAQKKTRQSIADKFFKKPAKVQAIDSPIKNIEPIKLPLPAQVQQPDQIAHSLNFTESNESRNKSRDDIQFTLNPKQKFSSLRPNHLQQEQQIQQQIAMSEYEQSLPKGYNFPNIKQPKQIKVIAKEYKPQQVKQPNQAQPQSQLRPQVQPQTQIEYQSIIKNPPRLQPNVSRSRSQKSTSQFNGGIVQQGADLGRQWMKIVGLMEQGSINQAFESALELDDPIYLLRLMLISKCPLKKLTAATVQSLWIKFMQIYSHRFIDILTVGILSQAQELNLLNRCLSLQQMQEALLSLYQLSGVTKGKLSYNAAALYNSIQRSLHPE